jgi:hypothetical protein
VTATGDFRLGPDNGRIMIKTTRAGLAAKAGHDLTIEVTRWSAQVHLPGPDAGGLAAATVAVDLDLGSLEIREGSGGAMPLTNRDRGEIKKTMTKILGAGQASFRSSQVLPADPGGAIDGTLTANGKSAPVRLQVSEPAPGRYTAAGSVAQTALGIKPYTGFFGALKLKDEVTLDIDVTLPAPA